MGHVMRTPELEAEIERTLFEFDCALIDRDTVASGKCLAEIRRLCEIIDSQTAREVRTDLSAACPPALPGEDANPA
jgi:hypothetical protein